MPETLPIAVGFSDLMASVQAGDELAAHELYSRWTGRLIRLANARLGRAIALKEDPEDVVQSVYRSFFRRNRSGEYHFDDWGDVWAILATIVRRKCSNRRAYYAADRRNLRRETPLADRDCPDTGPSAEEAASLVETIEHLLRGLEPSERAIVELSLQGFSASEIAQQLDRAKRSVQRVRQYVADRLRNLNLEDGAPIGPSGGCGDGIHQARIKS